MQAGVHHSCLLQVQGLACRRLSQGQQAPVWGATAACAAGAVADLHVANVRVDQAGILACVLPHGAAREAQESLPTLRKVLFSLSGPLTSATTSCSRAHSSV